MSMARTFIGMVGGYVVVWLDPETPVLTRITVGVGLIVVFVAISLALYHKLPPEYRDLDRS